MVDVHPAPAAALWPESIKSHWKLFLVEGIVLVVLGIGAILVPVLATLAVSLFLGWLFLIGGIVGAVTTLMGATPRASGGRSSPPSSPSWPGFIC